jgi:putative nucleotidyltransferase with HDIG domain
MIHRVKQVISALTAHILPQDRIFVNQQLNKEEQSLFWKMNLPDQRHALNVAYTARRMAEEMPGCDRALVLKCALLHDVGKMRGDVSTIDKVITVLAHYICPNWAKHWGRLGRGSRLQNLRHAFFIYFHHPERSAALLLAIHSDSVVADIVRRHHEAPAENDPPELSVLQEADNLH